MAGATLAVVRDVTELACCPPLLGEPIALEAAVLLAATFKAIGDPARVRLLSLIAAGPGGEACTCDLVDPLGLAQPTVSHHLKVLLDAGCVTRERRGTNTYYRIAPECFAVLRSVLQTREPAPA
jgi:ArsR family transcriptional regulator